MMFQLCPPVVEFCNRSHVPMLDELCPLKTTLPALLALTLSALSAPLNAPLPTTCRRLVGALVPMPTFVSAVAPLTPLIAPRTSELLCVTFAFAPSAVALVRLFEPTSALAPMTVLPPPVVFVCPALVPKNEFCPPVVLNRPAFCPKNELLSPAAFEKPA